MNDDATTIINTFTLESTEEQDLPYTTSPSFPSRSELVFRVIAHNGVGAGPESAEATCWSCGLPTGNVGLSLATDGVKAYNISV